MDENNQPVVDESVSTDDQEWEAATEEYAEDNGIELSKENDTVTEEETLDEETPEDSVSDNPDEPESVPSDTEPESSETAPEVPETPEKVAETPNPREVIREMEADRRETAAEVEKALYGDKPLELTDADGDPIRTIQDVQKLLNPVTGQQFTEEQAAVWLMQAQNHIAKQSEERRAEIEKVTETQLALKEGAESVLAQYKPILDKYPEVRQQVWEQYKNTLKTDESGEVILEAPIEISKFFETALKGYMELENRSKMEEAAKSETEAKIRAAEEAAAQAKKEAEERVKQVQTRNDREDILSTGKTDTRSSEEKEWDAAAKEYYED